MPSMQRAMSAYGQAAETLAPARQIVLLYDGAMRRIKEARRALEHARDTSFSERPCQVEDLPDIFQVDIFQAK